MRFFQRNYDRYYEGNILYFLEIRNDQRKRNMVYF